MPLVDFNISDRAKNIDAPGILNHILQGQALVHADAENVVPAAVALGKPDNNVGCRRALGGKTGKAGYQGKGKRQGRLQADFLFPGKGIL